METRKVIVSKKAKYYLSDLVNILYCKGYFGQLSDSEKYINKIRAFIETIPSVEKHRQAKDPEYGKYFARYDNAKSKMSYFIMYDMDINKTTFFIENIIFPKTEEYSALMGFEE